MKLDSPEFVGDAHLEQAASPSQSTSLVSKNYVDNSLSASNILNLLKTVDGVGSGLDADLFNGHDLTYFLSASLLGAASGVCPLGANSKVAAAYLPDSLVGALEYQGVWNATTNTPTIPTASSSNKGFYYVVNVAGTTNISGHTSWNIGDWVVSNGTSWDFVDNTDAVSSVNGRLGAITLDKTDVGLSNVDNTSDTNKPISSATQTALNAKAAVKYEIYDLGGSTIGKPANAAVLLAFVANRAFFIPANLANSVCISVVAPAATQTLTIKKNGVAVATFTFSTGSTSATLSTQAQINFAVNDILTVENQATADTSFSDARFTIAGYLT